MAALFTEEYANELGDVKIGDHAPDFELRTGTDEVWSLADYVGKVRVLLFYPQNETLVCTRQLCSVRDNWQQYLETKAEIVGISPSSPDEHRKFSSSRNLPIPLLADPNRDITKLYGKHWLYPIQMTRAIVVIDAKGIVRTRGIMLRAFRPKDDEVLAAIYAARGDAMHDKLSAMRTKRFNIFRKS